jgi:hypothetical protein
MATENQIKFVNELLILNRKVGDDDKLNPIYCQGYLSAIYDVIGIFRESFELNK